MFKQIIKYFTLLLVFTGPLFAQDGLIEKGQSANDNPVLQNTSIDLQAVSKISIIKSANPGDYVRTGNLLIEHSIDLSRTKTINRDLVANFVSSFRSNIRFGGFWEKYAIINFSPSMLITPFDFISIYGNHNVSYFIPVTAIKNEIKNLCIQSAAVLAVDNAFRFIWGSEKLIPVVTSFALKNIVLALINKSLNKKRSSEVYQYNSLFYSVSIRF